MNRLVPSGGPPRFASVSWQTPVFTVEDVHGRPFDLKGECVSFRIGRGVVGRHEDRGSRDVQFDNPTPPGGKDGDLVLQQACVILHCA